MSATIETFEFQTEARQLLDLMIHSVYSHKEIFLRELISNASDALDKLRYEAVTNQDLAQFTQDLHIRVEPDEAARTLTIHDNGIGMSREEIIQYIGTIAKSGTKEFLKLAREAKAAKELSPELIGQFGVGFYASFMVADKVTLVTRRAGESHAHRWESSGDGSYTIEEAERAEPGTSVTLHLKPADEDDELQDFTQEWTLRSTIRKYSDFVAYPIKMRIEREETPRDEDGKPKEGAEPIKTVKDETINSMKAIWTRPESEVTEEEYNEFYKHVSHDWNPPMTRIVMKAEGTSEFRALLYIPSQAPMDLFMRDRREGINLYIKRVFIMNDAKDLAPDYLRFLRGVVDSEDLSLNVSRELLQKDRQIQIIQRGLVRKVLDTLKTMKRDKREEYEKFWGLFGRVIKEGLINDFKNREALLELTLFNSTDGDGLTDIESYVGRMKEGQDTIYITTGENLAAVKNSPHLEAFRAKGYEVLLLADPVDEVWSQATTDYKEKKIRSVGKGEVELGSEDERKAAEEQRKEKETDYRPLLDVLKSKLDDHVKEVRLSNRLTSSPVCLVTGDHDLSPQLEQMMRQMGQEVPKSKRIMELNASHAILEKLKGIYDADPTDARLGEYAELLHGQAVLAEGGTLPDPAAYSKRVAELMARAL